MFDAPLPIAVQASPRGPCFGDRGARYSGRCVSDAIYFATVRSLVTGGKHPEGRVLLAPSAFTSLAFTSLVFVPLVLALPQRDWDHY